jgi:hypothetical protein
MILFVFLSVCLLSVGPDCCSRGLDGRHAAGHGDQVVRPFAVLLELGLVLGHPHVALLVHDSQVVARRRKVLVARQRQILLGHHGVALDGTRCRRGQVHGRHAVAAGCVLALARLLERLQALDRVLPRACMRECSIPITCKALREQTTFGRPRPLQYMEPRWWQPCAWPPSHAFSVGATSTGWSASESIN